MRDMLRDALRARGFAPSTYAVFGGTGEGRYFWVDGARHEEYSAWIVTRAGAHYSFWLTGRAGRAYLDDWRPCTAGGWERQAEYGRARAAVGLPSLAGE